MSLDLTAAAATRWFRSAEVRNLLEQHEAWGLHVRTEPLHRPASGSVSVVDKRMLKNWRRDGYTWKLRKDGKSILEHHERLKIDGVDFLAAMYSRCEDPVSLHRRAYSLLSNPNIILIHYLDWCVALFFCEWRGC